MLNTLRVIKIVALFFILAGFVAPSVNESNEDVMANLQVQSTELLSVYNGKLASSARDLVDKINGLNVDNNTSASRTDLISLWLSYGDLYRKASLKEGFDASNSKRVLVDIKLLLNKINQG